MQSIQRILTYLVTWCIGSSSVFLFFLIWELAPRVGIVDSSIITPPTQVIMTIGKIMANGLLPPHIFISLQRAFWGFAAASIFGILLGFLLSGRSNPWKRILLPLFQLWEKINPFALFPLTMFLFGIGELSKIAIIFWVCIWPVLFHTITAVDTVDPMLIKAAKSMSVDRSALLMKVVFPAALPVIFTGLKIGSQIAFFMIIAAEMVGASKGLGWLVFNAQSTYQMPLLFAGTVVISVLGLILTYVLRLIETKLLAWKQPALGGDI